MPESEDQGTKFEFTVAEKLNQGTNPGKGCNLSWVYFFVSFLDKWYIPNLFRGKNEKAKSLRITNCLIVFFRIHNSTTR